MCMCVCNVVKCNVLQCTVLYVCTCIERYMGMRQNLYQTIFWGISIHYPAIFRVGNQNHYQIPPEISPAGSHGPIFFGAFFDPRGPARSSQEALVARISFPRPLGIIRCPFFTAPKPTVVPQILTHYGYSPWWWYLLVAKQLNSTQPLAKISTSMIKPNFWLDHAT